MSPAENERLAILETKVVDIGQDVSEIKSDVKVLMQDHIVERGRRSSRSDLGIWVRAALPWFIGVLSASVTVYGLVTR